MDKFTNFFTDLAIFTNFYPIFARFFPSNQIRGQFFSAPSVPSVAYQFSIKSAGSWNLKSKNLKNFYLLF